MNILLSLLNICSLNIIILVLLFESGLLTYLFGAGMKELRRKCENNPFCMHISCQQCLSITLSIIFSLLFGYFGYLFFIIVFTWGGYYSIVRLKD